jgi:DNA repair ATPase RecN
MNGFSPKIEVINHFDNLINRVDIDIDECLEKYKQEQTIGELECFKTKRDVINRYKYIELKRNLFDQIEKPPAKKRCQNLWSESTKVVDYLNQIREITIEELRQAQKDDLEYLKLNSTNFVINDHLKDENKLDNK